MSELMFAGVAVVSFFLGTQYGRAIKLESIVKGASLRGLKVLHHIVGEMIQERENQ